jgi:hypothetical protein
MADIVDDCNHKLSNLKFAGVVTWPRQLCREFVSAGSLGLPENKIAKLFIENQNAPTYGYPECIPMMGRVAPVRQRAFGGKEGHRKKTSWN